MKVDLGKAFEETDIQGILSDVESNWEALGHVYTWYMEYPTDDVEMRELGKALDEHLKITDPYHVVPVEVDEFLIELATTLVRMSSGDREKVMDGLREQVKRFCLVPRISRMEPDYLYEVTNQAFLAAGVSDEESE